MQNYTKHSFINYRVYNFLQGIKKVAEKFYKECTMNKKIEQFASHKFCNLVKSENIHQKL